MPKFRIGPRSQRTSFFAGLICVALIFDARVGSSRLNIPPAEPNEPPALVPGKPGSVAANQNWWSIRPLAAPPVPKLKGWARHWARTPIDAFIAQRLETVHLRPSREADRLTLVRRLYFDLLGLPPSPEEVRSFVNDADPHSYENLVDRLLASPRYGELWARHWLDVVHYGDSHGYDKDQPRPNAWPYRDYVIRAFNNDKPYCRFVQEQLAGDVLNPDSADAIQATGFIAAGPWDLIGHAEVPETKIDGQIARHLDRDDMVTTAMGTFTSMTVQCAQCHNHKFDPISQDDYYSLQSVFAAVDRADRPYDDDPAVSRQRRQLSDQAHRLERQIEKIESQIHEQDGATKTASTNEGHIGKAEPVQAAGAPADGPAVVTAPAVLAHQNDLTNLQSSLHQIEGQQGKLPPPKYVYAGVVHYGSGNFLGTGPAGGEPRVIHVLSRGDVRKPGQIASPGALTWVMSVPARFDLPKDAGEGQRRLALAKWITDRRNPLPWRSIVNRVWQYHFGKGIVDTPNDFGKMGQKPTHPELLDWLAANFRDGDQSLKSLHRLIVTSATYRQSSAVRPDAAAIDGDNQLLWRMNRHRLEAEELRDSVLSVSGMLDLKMYGPGFQDFVIEKPEHSPHYRYDLYDPEDASSHRRSIYRFIIRSQQQPFLTTLDCADPSMQVAKRDETLTPLQALALLNDNFMLAMSKHFATRLEQSGGGLDAEINLAFQLAFGRAPRAGERDALAGYARQYGMANACRVILNLNEFIFVD